MDAESEVWSSGESEADESDSERDMTNAAEAADDDELLIDIDNTPDVFYDSAFYPSVKYFTSPSGIQSTINVVSNSPVCYFEIFFNSNLLQMITTQTNLYQEQNPEILRMHMEPWKPLTVDELRIFLGVTINMGHVRKGNLKRMLEPPVLPTEC